MDIVVVGHICLDMIPKWEKGCLDSLIPGNLVEMDGIIFFTEGGSKCNRWYMSL